MTLKRSQFNRDMGRLIKKTRQAGHLTQKQLGEMLQATGQYVSNIERGAAAAPLGILSALVTSKCIGNRQLAREVGKLFTKHLEAELFYMVSD